MTLVPSRGISRGAPGLVLGGAGVIAVLMVLAPPEALWGERHTPHLDKPPLALSSGQEIGQTFMWEAATLDGVVLRLDRTEPLPTNGSLHLAVQGKTETREASAAFADIPESGVAVFPLDPPLRGKKGNEGLFRVSLTERGQSVRLAYQIDSTKYPHGDLQHADPRKQGDLAFQLRYRRPALNTWPRQVGLALAILTAGSTVAYGLLLKRGAGTSAPSLGRADLGRALLLATAVSAVYGAVLLRPQYWTGASDFSKDAAYLASGADALRAGAWAIWSHRTCGGMQLLGNPEGNTFSLGTFIATFLPPDRALLLLLTLEAGSAAAGTFLLARSLKASLMASVAAAIIASLSASFPYRIVEGLTPVGGAVAFFPWILLALFWAFDRSSAPAAIVAGALLAAVFHRGDVHLIVGIIFVLAALSLTTMITRRSWRPLLLLVIAGASFFLGASVKLLPYLQQPSLIGGPLPPYVLPFVRERLLDDALLKLHDVSLVLKPLHDRRPERWGNFGGYVGVLSLVLAGIGLFAKHPARRLLLAGIALTFLLSEGTLFEYALRHLGPLGVLLRVPSRLWSLFALFVGLLAALGIDRIGRDFPGWRRHLVSAALVAALAVDLGAATRTVLRTNTVWDSTPPRFFPTGPTLAPHVHLSPAHERHPTKLLRAGFLLPKLCGDQNNPPEFVRRITEVTPLASVPSSIAPNQVALAAPRGPSDLLVRERFTPAWKPNRGVVLEAPDGSLHLVLPRGEPQEVSLTYRDPLQKAEQALLFFSLGLLGIFITRAVYFLKSRPHPFLSNVRNPCADDPHHPPLL